jgi:hypothetical protein
MGTWAYAPCMPHALASHGPCVPPRGSASAMRRTPHEPRPHHCRDGLRRPPLSLPGLLQHAPVGMAARGFVLNA